MPAAESPVLAAFVLFGLLAFLWNLFLLRSRNAQRKRRALRIGLPIVGVVTGAWLLVSAEHVVITAVSLAIAALIVGIYLKSVSFCDNCGRTVYGESWVRPATACPHCGSPLAR